jgi:hypothetical protein
MLTIGDDNYPITKKKKLKLVVAHDNDKKTTSKENIKKQASKQRIKAKQKQGRRIYI